MSFSSYAAAYFSPRGSLVSRPCALFAGFLIRLATIFSTLCLLRFAPTVPYCWKGRGGAGRGAGAPNLDAVELSPSLQLLIVSLYGPPLPSRGRDPGRVTTRSPPYAAGPILFLSAASRLRQESGIRFPDSPQRHQSLDRFCGSVFTPNCTGL
ncbi:hypothetical protein NDU88_004907 [Pleurodeles waltl]|uniref:Uncharacterized protein n=1 Tax=Pleurodeles waltl TaxID=8319 RepID=A0AAV7VLP5_PLEWA|nr:hypothetical protein NDU88_004907 [Pleurodeles waltl]